jgi:hypothetical protein
LKPLINPRTFETSTGALMHPEQLRYPRADWGDLASVFEESGGELVGRHGEMDGLLAVYNLGRSHILGAAKHRGAP